MRILALVPGGIGDQILFFPALDDLKKAYPDARLDVVVEPRAQSAYRVSKSVDDTILFDFKGSNSLADFANLLGVMRDREYDGAIAFFIRTIRYETDLCELEAIVYNAKPTVGKHFFLKSSFVS